MQPLYESRKKQSKLYGRIKKPWQVFDTPKVGAADQSLAPTKTDTHLKPDCFARRAHLFWAKHKKGPV